MTIEQIAIVALLAMQAVTFFLLWRTQQTADWYCRAWVRDTKELLRWKQNAIMRDPKTGRYLDKGQS